MSSWSLSSVNDPFIATDYMFPRLIAPVFSVLAFLLLLLLLWVCFVLQSQPVVIGSAYV
jgi:hypothetical protein